MNILVIRVHAISIVYCFNLLYCVLIVLNCFIAISIVYCFKDIVSVDTISHILCYSLSYYLLCIWSLFVVNEPVCDTGMQWKRDCSPLGVSADLVSFFFGFMMKYQQDVIERKSGMTWNDSFIVHLRPFYRSWLRKPIWLIYTSRDPILACRFCRKKSNLESYFS